NIHPIVYDDGRYGLNPELSLWTDTGEIVDLCDAADRYRNTGNSEKEADTLQKIEELYKGDFLEEDRFEDWILLFRQKFKDTYVSSLIKRADIYFSKNCYEPCIETCKKLLLTDSCDEQTHGRLMICYSRTGHNHLAMRQYQCCVEALTRELDITPNATTSELYERIRNHASV
ncbi:MAG: bacterial transcriptional activator domain-containing protein, partial [Geminicoccaceae bacterium]